MKKANGFSIFMPMIKTFGPQFFTGAAMKIVYDALAMVSPQMMKLMIGFVETNARSGNFTTDEGITVFIEKEEVWKGNRTVHVKKKLI